MTDDIKRNPNKCLFTADQVRRIFQSRQFKVHLDAGAVSYLAQVANDFGKGSLRTCRFLVEDAATLVRNRKKVGPTTWVTLDLKVLAALHQGSRRERKSADWVNRCFEAATVAATG